MRRFVTSVTLAATLATVAALLLPLTAGATVDPPAVASAASPFRAGCEGGSQSGTLYPNSEVEPQVAVNPTDTGDVVATWQQDRWSTGGAHGLLARVSTDGGRHWQPSASPPFSRCAGGTAANGGDYQRASDPWVSFGPGGTAYFMALSFNDTDNTNAMLAARSSDGGRTWGPISTLIQDTTADAFNDKNAITADPTDARYVYAVWDRLLGPAAAHHGGANSGAGASPQQAQESRGPTYLARSTDGGASWEPARPIFDPGAGNQTIGNQIAVLPDGTLLNLMTVFIGDRASVELIRSSDHGVTWSTPTHIDTLGSIGVTDPRDQAPVRTGDIIPDIAVDPRPGHDEVYVCWQDPRFSGGQADGIVLARSTDGGRHFSGALPVSPPSLTPAFTGTVAVDDRGVVAVTYDDFTFDSPEDDPLRTDAWITRSTDGLLFDERERLTPASFDLRTAPVAGGFFVGDYTGLVEAGVPFVALYCDTTGKPADPTDALAQRASGEPAPERRAGPPVATAQPSGGGHRFPMTRH